MAVSTPKNRFRIGWRLFDDPPLLWRALRLVQNYPMAPIFCWDYANIPPYHKIFQKREQFNKFWFYGRKRDMVGVKMTKKSSKNFVKSLKDRHWNQNFGISCSLYPLWVMLQWKINQNIGIFPVFFKVPPKLVKLRI